MDEEYIRYSERFSQRMDHNMLDPNRDFPGKILFLLGDKRRVISLPILQMATDKVQILILSMIQILILFQGNPYFDSPSRRRERVQLLGILKILTL